MADRPNLEIEMLVTLCKIKMNEITFCHMHIIHFQTNFLMLFDVIIVNGSTLIHFMDHHKLQLSYNGGE